MCTQGLVTVNISCHTEPLLEYSSCANMYILQCVVPTGALAPWIQRTSWIFIIVAIATAAIVVVMAW